MFDQRTNCNWRSLRPLSRFSEETPGIHWGSFTLSDIWIPCPGVSQLFMFMCFFVKCKSLYKSPTSFFPSNILMFFCSFGGRFCYYSFNHPSTSLFFFLLFQFIYMYRKTKASHLCCPAVMMISLSAVNMVKLKPQTKPSWRGGGRHGNMMIMGGEWLKIAISHLLLY